MKIHQITDLHVPRDDAEDFGHIKGYVQRQLRYIEAAASDLLVITGDLTLDDAWEPGCRWLADQLPEIPTIVIPGNHDNPDMIRDIFGEWPVVQEHPDCTLVFADTSTYWLREEPLKALAGLSLEREGLLFIHHPPHIVGSGYPAKNFSMKNHAETADAIRSAGIRHVFCGHLHNSAEVACEGFDLYLTPSPAYQVDLDAEVFRQVAFEPSVREILVEGGEVRSRLAAV